MKKYLVKIYINLKLWLKYCHFSFRYANYSLIQRKYGKNNLELRRKYNLKIWNFVENYLTKSFLPIFENFKNKNYGGKFKENAPIFVCWWDGFDNAPTLVKKCIKNIIANSNSHPVIIIDKFNYFKYAHIDSNILNKFNNDKMLAAQFCDYLRVVLIENNGGLWLDSTCFLSNPISEDFFANPFYTIKRKEDNIREMYANNQWSSFCLSGWKGNQIFKMAKLCFEKYWNENDYAINYFMIDHIIGCIFNHNNYSKKLLDLVKKSNENVDYIRNKMIEGVFGNSISDLFCDDTSIYKLSYRQIKLINKDGQKTLYGKFIEN